MGHSRLGSIPKSRKWKSVLALFLASNPSENIDAIQQLISDTSAKAIDALQSTFCQLSNDAVFVKIFYSLVELGLAKNQPGNSLYETDITSIDTTQALINAYQRHIDTYIDGHAQHTDISEIAQRAACQALSVLSRNAQAKLLTNDQDVIDHIHESTKTNKGFSALAHEFFSNFTYLYLNFHLSRFSADTLGKGIISNIADVTAFNDALYRHCRQSAKIISKFSEEWVSKTKYIEGINRNNISRYIYTVTDKISKEFIHQGGE